MKKKRDTQFGKRSFKNENKNKSEVNQAASTRTLRLLTIESI